MKTIHIYGDNRHAQHTKTREACRGIVLRDNMILMTYAVKEDLWMIPGGGLEDNESLRQCCIRELMEETGFIVDPLDSFVTIDEYYEEWLYRSHYFVCNITGQTQRQLTELESEVGLITCWKPFDEVMAIFANHQDLVYEEMKRGAYLREYSALTAYLQEVSP